MHRIAMVLVLTALGACSHPKEAPAPAVGSGSEPARVIAWRDDLHALATELPKRHVRAFFHANEADWRKAVDELDAAMPTLDDAHVIARLARLVAALGDAHTMIGVFGHSGIYPLTLVWFDDGMFVIGADAESSWAVGRKLAGIGTHSFDEVVAAMTPLVARDNDAGLRGQLPDLLLDPALLAGVELAPADRATFKLAAEDGSVRELELRPGSRGGKITPPRTLPLHLTGPATNYWNKYVAADRLLYFAYNACADDPEVGPLATFAQNTLAFADQHPVDRFVIDLRRNQGGNSRLLQPLIDGLAARPALAGHVYAIIGMHTFSSAMINAMELKRRLHATLVGGATSGKPSGYGEVGTFKLPHSHLLVQYSTKLFSNPDFPGDAVEPDVPVTVNSADWFAGRDPALDAILAPRR